MALFEPAAPAPLFVPWSVGGLIAAVASVLEYDFASCTVEGEITGLSRAGSGHRYFGLKDPQTGATLRCAMFRRAAAMLEVAPAEGQRVEVRGRLAIYEARGELQFVVEAMRLAGSGALYERFLRLKAQLEAEGLFDAAARRPLPPMPRRVGLVTSLQGAALHDVVTTLARRSPHVGIVVYPSQVQGGDAPDALCRAIAAAGERAEVDVLVVCRGGGSLEDLWAFNEECVVRAIRAASMPVVTGIGHETDVTLADLAADLRAPTPTAAAELVAPATEALQHGLAGIEAALARRANALLEARAQRLDHVGLRLARPGDALRRRGHRLDLAAQRLHGLPARQLAASTAGLGTLGDRLRHAVALARTHAGSRIERADARLQALDPTRVLERGYAMLVDGQGQAVTTVAGLRIGEPVQAHLRDGEATLVPRALARRPPRG